VLSYVTPGAIVAGCVLKLHHAAFLEWLKGLPTAAYIPLFGILFLIGLALQNLGELLRILKWHDRTDDKTHLKILHKFHSSSQKTCENEWLERTRERMAVKKIAAGTTVMATVISLGLIVLHEYSPDSLSKAEVILCLLLVIGLYHGHRRQLRAQESWEDDVTGN
jgi:hypothetical protein